MGVAAQGRQAAYGARPMESRKLSSEFTRLPFLLSSVSIEDCIQLYAVFSHADPIAHV